MKFTYTKNPITSVMKKVCTLLFVFTSCIYAQNRGNALAFQGLDSKPSMSVRSAGMGNAFTAIGGDVNALYSNPAGLASMNRIQIQISAGNQSRSWWENQIYRPNRLFFTLPFYLERLYIPDPANNGRWDHEVFFEGLLDTSYVVSLPDTGLENYSKDAADWIEEKKASGLNTISVAVPFQLFGKKMTIAGSVNPSVFVFDYDRNTTWLDPHISYIEYNMPDKVSGTDTLRMDWYDFERVREGSFLSVATGLGVELFPWLSLGLGMEFSSGESDDYQVMDKVGYFDLYNENQFMYSYDTMKTEYTGVSEFSSLKSSVGFLLNLERLSFGMNVRMPYTLNRNFNYDIFVTDNLSTQQSAINGTDEVKIPGGFDIGFSLKPAEKILISLDYSQTPYQNADWDYDPAMNPNPRKWVQQSSIRFGTEVNVLPFMTLRGGYNVTSQVFVPDGAALVTKGPDRIIWSFGSTLSTGKWGSVDIACELNTLKYYDQYFSNTNYVTDTSTRLMIGYRIQL
jgi:hypothetical protein